SGWSGDRFMFEWFDNALQDELFVRLLYFTWALPFIVLAFWSVPLAEARPILLMLPISSGVVSAILISISLRPSEGGYESFQAVHGLFWFFLIASVIVVYPVWMIVKKLRAE